MKKKEDLRIVKTKKNLYNALLLLMREKTFEEIKVLDICKEAMTNRSTFYDHFNDKYELLDSLIHDLEEKLTQKLNENNEFTSQKEYFMKMIELFIDHVKENASTYTPILLRNQNSIVMDMIYETCLKDVKEYMLQNKKEYQDIPIEVLAKFYVSGVVRICLEYVQNPKLYEKKDILSYLNQLLPSDI